METGLRVVMGLRKSESSRQFRDRRRSENARDWLVHLYGEAGRQVGGGLHGGIPAIGREVDRVPARLLETDRVSRITVPIGGILIEKSGEREQKKGKKTYVALYVSPL
jgi:hypothetical protein